MAGFHIWGMALPGSLMVGGAQPLAGGVPAAEKKGAASIFLPSSPVPSLVAIFLAIFIDAVAGCLIAIFTDWVEGGPVVGFPILIAIFMDKAGAPASAAVTSIESDGGESRERAGTATA